MPGDTAAQALERAGPLLQAHQAAQVLLIAVPRPTLAARFTGTLTDHPMHGELAETLRMPLQGQGWSEALADERLRAEGPAP